MIFRHAGHPGRLVRLAYCQNLHPGDTLEQQLDWMRRVTLPLRARVAPGAVFGAGLYLPEVLALRLAAPGGARELEHLGAFLADEGLDPFTFNAFPAGGFGREGLKQDVFRPTWQEPRRLEFTLAVAEVGAALLLRARGVGGGSAQLSLSTHPGMHRDQLRGAQDAAGCALGLARAAGALAQLEQSSAVRCVLAVEAEPRACAENALELAQIFAQARLLTAEQGSQAARSALARHLGACLDTCHAAVEFETDPLGELAGCGPLGKLQLTSALALRGPGSDARAVAALLALDEPCYLHQVTGRGTAGLLRAGDLPELRAALAAGGADWLACDEWRVHFHVPLDRERFGDGLETTRAEADRLLAQALAAPEHWGVDELHLEIETYTWSILPGERRGAAALVEGLEREYSHALGQLGRAGWVRA